MMTPEQEAVLRSIRKLVDFWQISAEELDTGLPPVQRPKPVPKAPPSPKYRHPITQLTWDGEGAQPAWLREALTQEGYTVDELRIPPASSNPETA